MSIGASEHRAFVRAKARFAGPKAQEHILSIEMLLHRTCCHVSLPAFSPISVMTSWPAWAAMAGGHNRRESTGDVGHARRSWNAVRDDYPRPSLTGNAARALPFPKSQRPTCPFSFAPGGTPPAPYGPLRHPPLPGVSLFRRFRCYLDRPHARHGPPRHPPLLGVSRFRRIGSHLRRVTRHPARHYGSGRPGTGSLLRCFCVEQEAARSRCALKTGYQLRENSEIQSC